MSNLLNNNQNTRDLININNENYRSINKFICKS